MSKITAAHVQAARTLKKLRESRGKSVDAKTKAIAALDPVSLLPRKDAVDIDMMITALRDEIDRLLDVRDEADKTIREHRERLRNLLAAKAWQ